MHPPRFWSLRSWPLRWRSRIGVCLLIAVLTIAAAETWVLRTSSQLRHDAGSLMLQTARSMADRLSREMAARVREVQSLSRIDLLRDATDTEAGSSAIRASLERLRAGLPAYAWIGVTDARGTVVAATDDVLLGQSIEALPVFRHGRQGLWSGDVHEAAMLAELAPHRPGEAARFVDTAAPIRAADGSLRGVLALHMSWQWAREMRDALLKASGAHSSQQLMVYGADGRLLLAPQAGGTPTLPTATLAALEEHWNVERWSDGIEAISASAESRSSGEFQGFGWRVVVRDPQAVSAADIERLRHEAWTWSAAIGAACMLVAWWLIGWSVAPVDRLARSPAHNGADTSPSSLGPTTTRPGGGAVSVVYSQRRNDVQRISAAVARMRSTLKDRELAIKTLEERAHHDPLTGLLNRAYLATLSERLERREGEAPAMEFCVLCLDLDDFKPINDRHGRAAGDQVLAQIGARLRHCARQQDFVFRLGGDGFMLLLPCPPGEASALARSVATRVLTDLQRPVSYLTLSGLRVGCSVGGAIWQPGAEPLAEAMERADEALHAAKRAGRGQFRRALPAARKIDDRTPDETVHA
ncbi:MAG TPA: sensor domain-containing diguanylate cyclase [Burkholderiaceae bacterium]|nr:sensor domain-containing diguanylate cyclase [Burkholderiaceae bacterium]